jgi:ASC-1-like (ASCH) protein
VSESWFALIKLGLKKCEGRLNKNNDFKYMRSCKCMITSIRDYDSFEKYLETETIKKCLPGIDTIEDDCKIYYNYFTKLDKLG